MFILKKTITLSIEPPEHELECANDYLIETLNKTSNFDCNS